MALKKLSLSPLSGRLTLYQLEVRRQSPSQHRSPENRPLRNITHQQFDDHKVFVHRLYKSRGERLRRCSPDGMLQMRMRLGVVQLDRSNPAQVKQVSSQLRVTRRFGESGFAEQFVGLVIKSRVEVVSEQKVEESGLDIFIVS